MKRATNVVLVLLLAMGVTILMTARTIAITARTPITTHIGFANTSCGSWTQSLYALRYADEGPGRLGAIAAPAPRLRGARRTWQQSVGRPYMPRAGPGRAVAKKESPPELNYKVPFWPAVQVSLLNSAQARQISIFT
jgi:hypothetical protein